MACAVLELRHAFRIYVIVPRGRQCEMYDARYGNRHCRGELYGAAYNLL